jgi:phosphoglycolate phosphatase-like HAD superfamily hydrolase
MRDALRAGQVDWPTRPVVLVDIDGTLSDPAHRLWTIRGPGRKNWNAFFASCDRDPPVEAVVRWTRALAEDRTVVLVSGRPIDKAGAKTLKWLERFRVPYFRIYMRQGGDRRSDTEVKQEILNDMLRSLPKECIAFAIDDRMSVVELVWRRNGIRVFPVRAGDESFV